MAQLFDLKRDFLCAVDDGFGDIGIGQRFFNERYKLVFHVFVLTGPMLLL